SLKPIAAIAGHWATRHLGSAGAWHAQFGVSPNCFCYRAILAIGRPARRLRSPDGPHLTYGYTRTLFAVFRLARRIVYNSAMFDSLFWAFLALAALLTITPGADTVLTLRNTLAGGTRDGLWTMAGVCSGFVFQPLLAALGVAALFVRLPLAFAVVKLAGAIYLIYLGGQ